MPDPAPVFHDHFSTRAAAYAAFRPRYPDRLFAELAKLTPGHRLAWDCATGNGQAATGLTRHFGRVVATDASAEQIANATAAPGVEYEVANAAASPLADHTADIVTVAQAAHWLDHEAFYHECRRVLVPDGIVALWCYVNAEVAPDIDVIVNRFYGETMGPYWTPHRQLVDARYRTIPFPFDEIAMPTMAIEATLARDAFIAYVSTWSSVQAYRRTRSEDPIPALVAELEPLWRADEPRLVQWPLAFRAGRVRS